MRVPVGYDEGGAAAAGGAEPVEDAGLGGAVEPAGGLVADLKGGERRVEEKKRRGRGRSSSYSFLGPYIRGEARGEGGTDEERRKGARERGRGRGRGRAI